MTKKIVKCFVSVVTVVLCVIVGIVCSNIANQLRLTQYDTSKLMLFQILLKPLLFFVGGIAFGSFFKQFIQVKGEKKFSYVMIIASIIIYLLLFVMFSSYIFSSFNMEFLNNVTSFFFDLLGHNTPFVILNITPIVLLVLGVITVFSLPKKAEINI